MKVYPRGILEEINVQRTTMQEENNDHQNSATANALNVSSLVLPGGELEDIPEDPLCEDSSDHDTDLEMSDSENSESSEEE